MRLAAQGWDNRRIAGAVGQHEGSVRNTLARVFGKLRVSNRTQAALSYWGLCQFADAASHEAVRGSSPAKNVGSAQARGT